MDEVLKDDCECMTAGEPPEQWCFRHKDVYDQCEQDAMADAMSEAV